MFCNKCGKNNPQNQEKCTYCGAEMPEKTGCSGFADILSFDTGSENMFGAGKGNTDMQNADLQKLVKKTDHLIKQSRKNTVLGLVAVLLSGLILISTVVFGVMNIGPNEEPDTSVNEVIPEDEKEEGETSEEPEMPEKGTPAPATDVPATEAPATDVPAPTEPAETGNDD